MVYRFCCMSLFHSQMRRLLRNEFNFWNVHGTRNTSGLLQSKWSPKGFMLNLQETQGAQWWSAWLETEGPRVWASPASLCCGPWARHIYPSLVLVQPRKTCPCLTERIKSNKTNRSKRPEVFMIPWTFQKLNLLLIFTFYNKYLNYKSSF